MCDQSPKQTPKVPRVVVAQIKTTKADYSDNLRRIGAVLADISKWAKIPDLVVFPETTLSGYFVEAGVREVAVGVPQLCSDLAAIHAAVGAPKIDTVVGFYEEFRNRCFNSAAYVSLAGGRARIIHVHRKVFLPTYGMFDEKRYISHGRTVKAFDTAWGRAGMLVCEDAWHSIMASLAALDGAQVLIVPSAAPARGLSPAPGFEGLQHNGSLRPASVRRWENMARRIADENGVYVVLAQPVGFEGGKALQGGSTIVAPDGDVLVSAPAFDEALIVADLDLDAITRSRFAQTSLADLENQLYGLLQEGEVEAEAAGVSCAGSTNTVLEAPEPAGHQVFETVGAVDPLAIDAELVAKWLVSFLRDEVVRRRGFTKAIVGLSGGVDSSLTATLAARALGPDNVIGVRMPYKTSSQDSLDHAALLARQLGLNMETVNITRAVDAYLQSTDNVAEPTRKGNVMARMRMIVLFDLSAKYDALPLGSGNKTERLFGYFTWHGDDSPPINPLGDLFKTQVWALARHLGVPEEIVLKAPSPDLVEGQTDERDLGIPYRSADPILHWLLHGLRIDQIVSIGFERNEVELVSSRLNRTHWKRRLPTVAVLSDTAIGESYLRPVDY